MRLYGSNFSKGFTSQLVEASPCRVVANIIGLASLMLALWAPDTAQAASALNANSPLGMNLSGMSYYNAEQPFLNIFRTSGVSQANTLNRGGGGFFTHSRAHFVWDTNEEAYLQLDANGYPTTLSATSSDPNSPQSFDSAGVLLLRTLPPANAGTGLPYPAGQYVVDYDGQGTLAFEQDAVLVSAAPGHYVFNVPKPSAAGIAVFITSTDPNHTGNYVRNIRIVKAEQESLLLAGNVFSPTFLGLMQNFRVLRAMQWLQIDNAGGLLTNWSQRPQATDGGWGGPNGVPVEIVLQLCNAIGADCWLNLPHMASDDYITQMATLAHANLGTSQKVYVEYSNEVWNTGYVQWGYAEAQGKALWPNGGSGFANNWYGMRVAQTCDIWKAVWGADASRVVCVMGAQAAWDLTATLALSCPMWAGAGHGPCASHGIDVVAIAPYFEVKGDPAWLSASDGGLSSLFAAINNTALPAISSWEAAYKKALAPYNLPFITYEGGQGLVGEPTYQNGSPMVNLYTAANRDPRMGTAYTTMLNNWKANGGQTLVIYADISAPSKFGEWGALESFMDTVNPLSNAPPKWQALQSFISASHCWWPGCVGAIGTATPTPMAPTLTVK
jgi:hypothetical protein